MTTTRINGDILEYPREFVESIKALKPDEQEAVKKFWRSVVMRSNRAFSEENGPRLQCSNMRSCSCCPYGYHIDLDFVRYCESLANAKPSEEQLRRRSRRRSRKSMEFMLGLESLFDQWDAAERVQAVPEATQESEPESPRITQPLLTSTPYDFHNNSNNINNNNLYRPLHQRANSVPRFTYGGLTRSDSPVATIGQYGPTNSRPETRAFLRDALDEVCSDFERTLERATVRRKKGVGGGVNTLGVSPKESTSNGGVALRLSDRNNNFLTATSSLEKRSCHTWEEYVDALDSCVAGNKSPRASRSFTRSATLPLPPSPHRQLQQQAEKQYESYVQATVAANAAKTVLEPRTPPPPPPRRHLGRLRSATPDQLISPLSEKNLLSPSPADGAGTDAQTLFNIRQQMALSLKRMKDLEEQVKTIPELQNELTQLRDEKQRLQNTLQRKEDELLRVQREPLRLSASPSPVASPKFASPVNFTPQRISPIALESLGARMRTNSTSSEKQLKSILKREVGTMCGLHTTRDVAVGSPVITLRTVSTSPMHTLSLNEVLYTRHELDEHIDKALMAHEEKQRSLVQIKKLISVGTQMFVPKRDVRDSGMQTVGERKVQQYSVSVMAKPTTRENFVTCKPDVRSVGCSEDRLSDVLCPKCAANKRSVACGTDQLPGETSMANAVSLKLLDMTGRSNTFSLGDNEKLSLKRKTIGTQYTPVSVINQSIQTSQPLVLSVGVQNSPLTQNCGSQSLDVETATRQTDTRGLIQLHASETISSEIAAPEVKVELPPAPKPIMYSSGCNTDALKAMEHGVNTVPTAALRHTASNTEQVAKRDFGCGETVKPHISIACADNYCDSCKDAIKNLAKDFASKLPPPSPLPTRAVDSKIPRPRHLTSPSPVRKQIQRQNTYTITPSPTPSPVAEKKSLLSSLQEKPSTSSKLTTSTTESNGTSEHLKISPTSRIPSPRRRTTSAQRSEELESVFSATPPKSYELSHRGLCDHSDNLIVKEETCVRISWSRDASPAPLQAQQKDQDSPPTSLDSESINDKLMELSARESRESTKSQSPDVSTGARPKAISTAFTTSADNRSSQSDVTTATSESTVVEVVLVPRERIEPSKQMCSALNTINEALRRPSKITAKSSSFKAAKTTVQQEWFRISSAELANVGDVEDYLVAFRDISVPLLEFCVNMVDSNGNTAMHYAVSHGNFEIVSSLLDSKVCNVNQMNNAGYTCVMLVSLAKLKNAAHRTVVQRLFQMADVNIRAKKHCQTALMLAVSHGNLDMVEMLLAAGADINLQDEDGSTALMCAAEHGRVDIVKHLLSQTECDSLVQDVDGSTAFKIAWQAGHRDIGLLLYVHEQMLRSKMPHKGEPSAKTSLHNHKRQPSQ